MERVKIYRIKKSTTKYFMIFGAIALLAGMILLVKTLTEGVHNNNLFTIMVYPPITGIGFFALIYGYLTIKKDKYFFEWDDVEIAYFLPGQSSVENIKISDIKDVSVKIFEITITFADSETKLNFPNIEHSEFNKIKAKLANIKANL